MTNKEHLLVELYNKTMNCYDNMVNAFKSEDTPKKVKKSPSIDPLHIVDGIETDDKEFIMESLMSSESVIILEEPSIIAPYVDSFGEKAKNGVVIITTKK